MMVLCGVLGVACYPRRSPVVPAVAVVPIAEWASALAVVRVQVLALVEALAVA